MSGVCFRCRRQLRGDGRTDADDSKQGDDFHRLLRCAPSMCAALTQAGGGPDHRLANLSTTTQFTKNTRSKGKSQRLLAGLLGLQQTREMARHGFANAQSIDASRQDASGKASTFSSRKQAGRVGALQIGAAGDAQR